MGRIDPPVHNGNERDCQTQVRADAIGLPELAIKQYSERLERFDAHLEEVVSKASILRKWCAVACFQGFNLSLDTA